MGTEPALRFVTGSLKLVYKQSTPIGVPLEIRGRIEEVTERKVVVSSTLYAEGELCATGEVVAVQMPAHLRG